MRLITAAGRLNPTSTRCMWLPATAANAPARIPEPPQQPVHELKPEDDEYREQLEVIAMGTFEAIEAREQSDAATMVGMSHIPNSSRY